MRPMRASRKQQQWLRNGVPHCGWDCVKMIDLAEGRSLRSVMGCYLLTLCRRSAAAVCDRPAAKFLAE
jgi:hypothetical protein